MKKKARSIQARIFTIRTLKLKQIDLLQDHEKAKPKPQQFLELQSPGGKKKTKHTQNSTSIHEHLEKQENPKRAPAKHPTTQERNPNDVRLQSKPKPIPELTIFPENT
jgi:hypothetical protein